MMIKLIGNKSIYMEFTLLFCSSCTKRAFEFHFQEGEAKVREHKCTACGLTALGWEPRLSGRMQFGYKYKRLKKTLLE